MTLVELLVVVTILALLTSVAVTSTDVFLGQGRYEATQRTLAEISGAVIDDASGLTGFVVDMGRLPVSLDELLGGTITHQVWSFDSDGDGNVDIQLAGGWRGPYLRLAPGQETLRDGWGQAFRFRVASEVLTVDSPGADGEFDASQQGYDRDLGLRIEPADYRGSLAVHVRQLDASGNEQDPQPGENVVLRLYKVVDGQVVAQQEEVHKTTFQCGIEGLPAGAVAVRALAFDAGNTTPKKKSPASYITVRPRSTSLQKLVLPYAPQAPANAPSTP